jgi:hypothetical protein
MNSANDLIEMLFTNPELIDQHSSYQWKLTQLFFITFIY